MPKTETPCASEYDCIETEACYMGFCVNPCQLREVCVSNAICQVKKHRPICMCPKSTVGNPQFNCTSIETCKMFIKINLVFLIN